MPRGQNSNVSQDGADAAILGWDRRQGNGDTQVILASIDALERRIDEGDHRTYVAVRDLRERATEWHRIMVSKDDRIIESLVRMKRPVFNDLEWEREQELQDKKVEVARLNAEAEKAKMIRAGMWLVVFVVFVVILLAIIFAR